MLMALQVIPFHSARTNLFSIVSRVSNAFWKILVFNYPWAELRIPLPQHEIERRIQRKSWRCTLKLSWNLHRPIFLWNTLLEESKNSQPFLWTSRALRPFKCARTLSYEPEKKERKKIFYWMLEKNLFLRFVSRVCGQCGQKRNIVEYIIIFMIKWSSIRSAERNIFHRLDNSFDILRGFFCFLFFCLIWRVD